jgi:CP family cyanate transporter-like MFS transporter
MTIGAVLRGLAIDYPSLMAATFILGAGGAFLLPNLSKLTSLWVPQEKAGITMGLYFSMMTAGGALTMAITLPIIYPITGTLQGTFLIISIPCVIATIMWWALVRETPPVSSYENPAQVNNIPVSQVLKNRSLWLIAIFFFITSFFFHNWIAWAPELMMAKGTSADTASIISSSLLWVAIPSVLLAPRVAHRMGIRKPFLLIPSIALALAPLWAIYMTAPMGWPLMIMVGIFDSARTIMVLALPLELMPKETVGTASGLIVSVGFSGGVVGPMIGGLILDLTGTLNMSLVVLFVMSLAAVAIANKIPETGYKTN